MLDLQRPVYFMTVVDRLSRIVNILVRMTNERMDFEASAGCSRMMAAMTIADPPAAAFARNINVNRSDRDIQQRDACRALPVNWRNWKVAMTI